MKDASCHCHNEVLNAWMKHSKALLNDWRDYNIQRVRSDEMMRFALRMRIRLSRTFHWSKISKQINSCLSWTVDSSRTRWGIFESFTIRFRSWHFNLSRNVFDIWSNRCIVGCLVLHKIVETNVYGFNLTWLGLVKPNLTSLPAHYRHFYSSESSSL